MFYPLFCCFPSRTEQPAELISSKSIQEKYTDIAPTSSAPVDESAEEFVTTLLHSQLPIRDLQLFLFDQFSTTSWSESLAVAILKVLDTALRNGVVVGSTLKEALEKSLAEAVDFAKEHPAFMTLIALGVLVIVAPWVLGWLGFGELGIVEGKCVAFR